MARKLIVASLVLLLTTALYTCILYQAELADDTCVVEKIQAAIEDGSLLPNLFPASSVLWTRDNLSGLDQSIESFYALMVLYRDLGSFKSKMMNALNPGLYQAVDDEIPQTEEARLAAYQPPEERADRTIWKIDHKPRFWHGVKAVLLYWFRYLHLSQLYWAIQVGTFCAFAFFAVQVMYQNREVGLAYLAFTLSAFFCSSVLFFGGVAYSVPLLSTAVWGCLWLAFRSLPWRGNRSMEIALVTFGGTLLCFFFQLGGCEIYAMSLIVFIEIFLPMEPPSRRTVMRALESCAFFLLGFFGSIALKHLLIVVLSGSLDVAYELVDKILLRTSDTNSYGTKIGFWDVFMAQFEWYGVAGYGIDTIHKFVNASKTLSATLLFAVPLWIAALRLYDWKEESEELLVAFCGFCMMLAMVAGRYMLLRNHSDIHVFFVSRYLFVYAGTTYFFIVWLFVRHRRFLPLRRRVMQAMAPEQAS